MSAIIQAIEDGRKIGWVFRQAGVCPHCHQKLPAKVASNLDPVEVIIAIVAERFNITPEKILSGRKQDYIAWPRQICFWMLREHTQMSLSQIGARFNRHHGTVLHGWKAVQSRKEVYAEIATLIISISNQVKAAPNPEPANATTEAAS